MNTENALAEEIRQYNESMAFEREQWNWQVAQAAARSSGGGGGGGGGGYSGGSGGSSSSKSASIKKSSSSGSGGDLPSDTAKSILSLGQGPISATNLANQVNSGKVVATTSPTTGNTLFTNASSVSAGKYSKYKF
jgi:hypothetical protein